MSTESLRIPLLPLAKDTVLLPGCTLRIPVSDRNDVANIMTSLYSKSAQSKKASLSVVIGCVPLNSPLLSPDGKRLLDSAAESSRHGRPEVLPQKARAEDIFRYGTLAKIIGVQGRPASEPYLLVEGTRRFTLEKIHREKPFLEATVSVHEDPRKVDSQMKVILG